MPVGTHVSNHVKGSGTTFESQFSLHSRDTTQVIRHGSKCLCLVSQSPTPSPSQHFLEE